MTISDILDSMVNDAESIIDTLLVSRSVRRSNLPKRKLLFFPVEQDETFLASSLIPPPDSSRSSTIHVTPKPVIGRRTKQSIRLSPKVLRLYSKLEFSGQRE